MKIKTKQKLNLPELINHVWENDIESTEFLSNQELRGGKNVRVHVNPRDVARGRCAGVSVESGVFMVDDSYTFTVEVEEELTEETVFDELWEVYYHKPDGEIDTHKNCEKYGVYSTSISQILKENSIYDDNITLAIYYGSTLIWTKDSGIPADGVLEVSE